MKTKVKPGDVRIWEDFRDMKTYKYMVMSVRGNEAYVVLLWDKPTDQEVYTSWALHFVEGDELIMPGRR